MMREWQMGGMRVLRLALLWILLKAQMPSVESLGEHALVTVLDPNGEKETKKTIKCGMMGSREVGWRKGFLAGKKEKQKQPG